MRGAFIFAAVAIACAPRPEPPPPVVPLDTRQPELLQRALIHLAEEPPDDEAAERLLTQLSAEHGVFAEAAGALLALLDERDASRATIAELEPEIASLNRRLSATEHALADLHEAAAEETEAAVHLRDERARLTRKLSETEARVAEHEATIAGLREELEALKRIDMQRSP